MRKRLFPVFLALLVLSLMLGLLACGQTDATPTDPTIATLTVTSSHIGDYVVGEDIDFSEITVTAVYSDGSKREFPLSDDLLEEVDKEYFFVEGVHTVTVTYFNKKAVFQISVVNPEEVVLYRATFYSYNGDEPFTEYGTVIKAFRAPQKEGYYFAGWYTNPELTGSKALAPFTLTEDTRFYARWVDTRTFTVRFYDEGKVLYEVDVVQGDTFNYEDKELFPDPTEKEGKTFLGWSTNYESNTPVTGDIVINAQYEDVYCVVQIEYAGNKSRSTRVLYGNKFSLKNENGEVLYELPTEPGHTSRWVIYPMDAESDAYEEFPEGQDYVVVKRNIFIRAKHEINTYSISIYNGKEEEDQSDADLKSGAIASQRIYNPLTNADYKVDYAESFLFSAMTQTPYLKEPTAITGYDCCWCFVTSTLTGGEVYRNFKNEVWDDATEKFVRAAGDLADNFALRDREGNYLATVKNGDLINIQGDVTIRAKYYKKEFTVTLRRKVGTAWETVGTPFTEKYRDDFKLYDPAKYDGARGDSAQEVESSYLLHNVALWSTDPSVYAKWRSIYYVEDEAMHDDDWLVEWYSSSEQSPNTLVDFTEQGGEYGSFEIRGNLELYCKDIDLRRYTVVIYYGYNFAGTGAYLDGAYDHQAVYENLLEKQEISLPQGSMSNVIRRYPAYDNKTVTYQFDEWYDYPYFPEDHADYTGYKGAEAHFDSRTRNIVYYAHYKCDTTFTLTVYDRTQREKYAETALENGSFDVPLNTIRYEIPAGTLFTSDMLYKGTVKGGVTISGNVYYQRATFMESVLGLNSGGSRNAPAGEVTTEYETILTKYHGATLSDALTEAQLVLAQKEAVVNNFNKLLTALFNYNYVVDETPLEDLFASYYLTPYEEYHTARKEVQEVKNDIEILESYAEKLTTAQNYYDENTAVENVTEVTAGSTHYSSGLYKKYLDSARDLNAAYNKDVSDANEKVKFKFSGWYLDENYGEPYDPDSREIEFTFFASTDSIAGGADYLNLYAKWADEEKGSEGLVFKAVYNAYSEIIGVVVADYVTNSEYIASDFAGCGFNNFAQSEYSINFDDSEHVPTTLGTNIDLQIPAGHGGPAASPYPVLGILSGAFSRHGTAIRTISLPDGVRFFEEGAFRDCYLNNVSGSSNENIAIVEERAVYQLDAPAVTYYQRINDVLTPFAITAHTLIGYATKFPSTNIVSAESLDILAGTVRVGEYALFGANSLKYVKLNAGLTSIGAYAFANSALSGSDKDTAPYALSIPDSLVRLEEGAFINCVRIQDLVLGTSSISYVGKDSVFDTAWYTNKKGVVTLNNIVIGVRDCSSTDFVKVLDEYDVLEGKYYYYENADGIICYDKDQPNRGIKKVILKNTVRRIGSAAFETTPTKRTTSALEVVEMEAGINLLNSGVGDYAFKGCSNLNSLILKDLSSSCILGEGVFTGCSKPTVYVTDVSALDLSWTPQNNGWTLEQIV